MLSAMTFGLLIALVDSPGHGERPFLSFGEAAALLVFGYLLVRRELCQAAPLLPLDLLRIPMFSLSVGTSICSFTAQMLALVSLPFFLQGVLHFTARGNGTADHAVAIGDRRRRADCRRSGRSLSSRPVRAAPDLVVFAAGLVALALMPPHASAGDIVWRMALAGAGFGLFQSPNNRAMIGSAPRERSGGASGMLGTARLLGQTMGAALVAMIFARSAEHGEIVSLSAAAGFALLAACVSSLRLMDHPGATASRPLRDSESAIAD